LNNLSFKNYPELKALIYWGESYAWKNCKYDKFK
jgi:hypothetical protein